MPAKPKSETASGGRQSLRIIGGQWRSRKISFPDRPQLRPTPDRVRETLFNWLAPIINGARCLDLFAGSGALGIEALSRGADSAVFVETDHDASDCLRQQLALLKAQHAQVVRSNAMEYLHSTDAHFDIVFVDPPYESQLLVPVCQLLEQRGLLAANARIYLETANPDYLTQLPPNWQLLRSKRAGQVHYHLAVRLAN